MRLLRGVCVLCLPVMIVGCGGGGISPSALGGCIEATGREVLVDDDNLLVYDTVRIRSSENEASIYVWDSADRAKEDYERDRFEADPEERSRFMLVENAEVVWDEPPSNADEEAVSRCLEDL